MMILRSSPASPFARKVRIALDVVGLAPEVQVSDADTTSETDAIRQQNPLGKIPALILENGTAVYDSAVILDYLDHLSDGALVPVEPADRLRCQVLQALADGLMEAALLIVYEGRWRPDAALRSAAWTDHQGGKIARALKALETGLPEGPVDAGQIATACALGYLDLRFAGAWRATHPGLVAWLDAFAARVPAFEATRFQPPAG